MRSLAFPIAFALLAAGCGALADRPDSAIPPPGPAPEVKAPVPEVRPLAFGAPLWHIPARQVPLVSLAVLVRCGAADDPPGKAGLAALSAAMLDEGAGSRGAIELAEELEYLGASLGVSADRETSEISLLVLRRNLEPALDLLADVLLRPRFEEKEWERVRTLWLNNLVQARDQPNQVARVVGDRVLFGDDHPYGRPVSGSVQSVRSIDLDEVRTFHADRWRPAGAVVIACGAIDAAELAALLDARLGGWKDPEGGTASDSASRPPPAFPERRRPRLAVVNKPGATQTVIRAAGAGIARGDPDFIPLSLANSIFGGSFTSRLSQNLRETRGYTYGIGSNFSRLSGPGAFVTGSSVRTDVTGESIAEIAAEYRRMEEAALQGEEIRKARAVLRSNVVESLESISSLVEMFADLARAGLPPEEVRLYLDGIESATAQEIERAAKRIVRWENATVVLVGDVESIRKEIAESGLYQSEDLALFDEEGNPAAGR